MRPDPEITDLLSRWSEGDRQAAQELLPLVYEELRRRARASLRSERSDHTLQPTALVHEAYLRLAKSLPERLRDRAHFYALAARVMRQVLVDHARRRMASKRGSGKIHVQLDRAELLPDPRGAEMLRLDEALDRLKAMDPRQAQIIELRFFGGLTLDETAEILEYSTPTVIKEARKARAWLYKELVG